ncbi:hypothetical protein LTR85_008653 [Meristemomyces frigidus]|nr:hypothetical protein LTR85_008653 [Meristemomyces frigidus]
MANSIRAFELRKYYNPQASSPTGGANSGKPPSDLSKTSPPSHDALAAFTQVVSARLGVSGACVALTDGTVQNFVAGSTDSRDDGLDGSSDSSATAWFEAPDAAQGWLQLSRRILEGSSGAAKQRVFCIPDLTQDDDTKALPPVTGPPHLRFYAAAPILTDLDICIGVLCVVHDSPRQALSNQEAVFLQGMAKRCMGLLQMTREVGAQRRGLMMSDGIDSFIQHREGVQVKPAEKAPSSKATGRRKKFRPGETPQPDNSGGSTNIPQETSQAHEDSEEHPERMIHSAQQANKGHDSDAVHGETTYRKTFKRAAACLRMSLEVDGVMFVNGFIGWHGGMMPAGEPELELERENTQISKAEGTKDAPTSEAASRETRVFTSADYRKEIYTARSAEILGYAIQYGRELPPTTQVTESTKGLAHMNEGFLQHFLERHHEGRIWYFDEARRPFRFDGDALVPGEDEFGDAEHVAACFPSARQVIFSPLTDPVALKHLAGCFAWTSEIPPVFTDGTVLCSYKAFLHSVVAEISRLDTVAAVKQQSSFVSSVSHELRSPLHGILGAAELLAETDLDEFQNGLADTIRACGSTLQDTLSNVLSYAKINDFEQKQNKGGQARPKDSPWALENKAQEAVQQNGPSSGLFVPTDIALLCEDIVQVLESGRSYHAPNSDTAPNVTLNIGYRDSWLFMTEPGALRRIFMNIIGNAMKYSPGGAVVVSLDARDVETLDWQDEAKARQTDEGGTENRLVVFTVKDTGKGMSTDFLENRLFLPFHQEDAIKSEGVGLGMSIVKSLANLLAGKIEVTSQLGEGTEFKISIPMAAGKTKQHAPGAPAMEQSLATLRARELTVAIHGLDHATAQSLRAYLRDWFDCAVGAVDDEGPQPDIILVDGTDKEKSEELRTRLKAYDQRLAVLTVSVGPPKRASSTYFAGKHIWERVSRPLGPHKLAKALARCLERLQHSDQAPKDDHGEGQKQKAESTAVSSSRGDNPVSPRQQSSGAACSPHSPTGRFSPTASDGSHSDSAATPLAETGPSILLVEDNKINLKLLETFITKKGYTNVESAADGLQAVQAAERRAEGFDVIITDVMMPVMDGFAASRKIRELERTRRSSLDQSIRSRKPALLVALTGLASANDRDKALLSGVDVFVTKPVKFEELGALLARWERGEIEGGRDREAVEGASSS